MYRDKLSGEDGQERKEISENIDDSEELARESIEREKQALDEFDRIVAMFEKSERDPEEESESDLDKTRIFIPEGSEGEGYFPPSEEDEKAGSEESPTITSGILGGLENMLKVGKNRQAGAAGKAKTPKKNKPKKRYRLNLKRLVLVLLALGVISGGAVGGYVFSVVKDAPEIQPENIYDLLAEHSVILDSEGNLLENVYAGDSLRTNVSYDQFPEDLKDAFIAIEDKTFEEHKGFNIVRIVGAIVQSAKSGDRIGGTSTITQQLARNLYLTGKREMKRKIQEAWYTIQIERALTKEQILEAYLNTIYLGFNSHGVQAASQAYFSKDVEELSLIECAMLASLPQNPRDYAPMKRESNESIEDPEALDIIEKDDEWTVYYNDGGENRLKLTLYLMHEQGKISDEEYEAAKADSIREYIDPGINILSSHTTSFFADYVTSCVLEDLAKEHGLDPDEAYDMLYKGGLTIRSTMDRPIQTILDEEYEKPSNFPGIGRPRKDRAGNILDAEGKILLYSQDTFFTSEGEFEIKEGEYKIEENGDIVIFKSPRLNIYNVKVGGETDYNIEFKNLYKERDGMFYSRSGGVWDVPAKYKMRRDDGSVVISADFMKDREEAGKTAPFRQEGSSLFLGANNYTLKGEVMQPQSAMVIMDYRSGHIKAMTGGRGLEGKKLFNRALSPRQPGSAIKPIGVYGPALQAGFEGLGPWHAASPIDDAPIKVGGAAWPKNWYEGYTGINTLRRAVEQSINACAVNLFNQLDMQFVATFLKNMGVTTLVEQGEINDMNAAALALGGMTKGISVLEMTGAYGAFGNDGTYIEPICYTEVLNSRGDVILSRKPVTHEVMSKEVASLTRNIMLSTVNNGIASGARISSQPVAGKTGTTSERYDIWFCGLTPQFSAAVWVGNDVNIPMSHGSGAATALWSRIMQRVCADIPRGQFTMDGEFVTASVDRFSGKLPSELSEADPRGAIVSDIFIAGTVPSEVDESHKIVSVCAHTGYLATPDCPSVINKLGIVRPSGISWEKYLSEYTMPGMEPGSVGDAMYDAPDFYCPLHNYDPETYPISPFSDMAVYNPLNMDDEGNIIEGVPEPEEGGNGEGSGENAGTGENGGTQVPPTSEESPEQW